MRVVALILSLMMVPFKASADSIFLMCRYNENIKTVNAQGKLIQDDWHEYTTTIDLRNDQYYRTIFDNEHQYASQGLVNTTAQKYFLKSSSAQYGNVLSEIFVQTFIDRTTGEFYSDVELLNNEVGAISSFVSRGTCELQDAPITKF